MKTQNKILEILIREKVASVCPFSDSELLDALTREVMHGIDMQIETVYRTFKGRGPTTDDWKPFYMNIETVIKSFIEE